MLEKQIEDLGKYFDSISRLKEGYTAVKVIIPDNWTILEKTAEKNNPSDFSITTIKKNEGGVNKVIFVGDPKAKVTDIITFIDKVIKRNVENEEKTKLFRLKVKELADIFDNNELSKLKNIVFDFKLPLKEKKITKIETNSEIESVVVALGDTNNIEVVPDKIIKKESKIIKESSEKEITKNKKK